VGCPLFRIAVRRGALDLHRDGSVGRGPAHDLRRAGASVVLEQHGLLDDDVLDGGVLRAERPLRGSDERFEVRGRR
jgi:hypothetical protein